MMGETDKPPESNGGEMHPHSHHHHSGPPPPGMMHHHMQNGGPNAQGRKFSSYKLIVDPALVKGALKVYRFDGVIPGDPSYPSILVRDPRKQKSLRRPMETMILPVPAFKIDANFVGEIPPTEVTFTNLNDNVGQMFLHTLSMKFGIVEDVQIFLHPISHRHLGFGHTIFKSSRDAKTCVEKLNGTLVMGQKVNVFHDPNGKKCKELFIEVTTQKPGGASSNIIKDDGRKASSSSSSAPALPGPSSSATSSTSSIAKPPLAKSLSNVSSSSSKQSHMAEPHGHYSSHGHHYKEDPRQTPHYDTVSVSSAASDDRKSSHSVQSSSKGSSRSRERDRDRGRNRDEGYKRYNSSFDRYENSNYGYPVQPGSSRSTPSTSSLSSSHSGYHHHHHHHHHHHQQQQQQQQQHQQPPPPPPPQQHHYYQPHSQPPHNSHPPSPHINAASKGGGENHQLNNNNNNYGNSASASDKVCEEGELSPKIDLDTRIKMMLEGRNSGEFGKLFTEGNISVTGSDSESDADASPLKRARLSLAGAKIWDSESDEEVNKEASFAKKFKQSFVPVNDGSQVASSSHQHAARSTSQHHHHSMSSPPPSPFLTFTASSAVKSVRGKADPEFDQISDDDDGQVGGGAAAKGDKDDMSLSSLSPDDAAGSRIRQTRFSAAPPPPPPPPPMGQVQSTYYGEYSYNAYSSNYQMQAWGSHHHQHDQQHYHHHAHHQQHHHEYQGNYQPSYSGSSYDHHHHRHYPPSSSYPPPNTHPYPDKPPELPMQIQRPPTPPPQEDHKNPELLIKALIEVMVEDLKKVLRRDCNRRLIETEAFKMYEEWWDRQEKEFKRKQDEENAKNLPTSASQAAAPEVIIDESAGGTGAVVIAARAPCAVAGLAAGLGLLNSIPKLPSFRRHIKAPEPVQDEDSRKSFLDSDSDSLASSDEEEIVGRKSKPRFLSTTDDDSDTSSVSSKSDHREEEVHDVTDAEVISTTEDEEEFASTKTRPLEEEEEELPIKLPPTPRMEVEDILSEDDLPEEAVRTPEHEQDEGSLGICQTTGRLFYKPAHPPTTDDIIFNDMKKKVESLSAPVSAPVVEPPVIKQEVEDGEIEEKALPKVAVEADDMKFLVPKTEDTFRKPSLLNYQPFVLDTEKPLIIPYDVMQPRGSKKSSKSLSFRPRMEHERLDLVYEFLKEGIDAEDMRYFHKAYENLLFDDTLYWLNCTHWVDHPETVIKTKKPKSKASKSDSEEGSLRTRGFVRMTKEEKSRAMAGQEPVLMSFDGAFNNEKRISADLGKARETQIREARSNQRRLLTVLGAESDLLKFNQLHFRKKALRFARSGIHDWGLFAAEPIAADEMVIEYVGQMIRPVIADLRETKYEAQGIGSSYLFKIDPETIIDATRCGNLSRFINHSCNPNCYAKVITIEGKKKMVIYSKQPIAVSEEITYDYKFPIEDKKIPCLCGTPQCRGTLN